MRRPTLSTKLLAAALPLLLAMAALLTLAVRNDLADARSAESGAQLGAVWNPLIDALAAIDAETGEASGGAAPTAATRRDTDQAINAVREQIEPLGAFDAANAHITAGRSALSAARRNLDMATVAPDLPQEIDPFEAYDTTSRELVAVGQLLPSEAGDPGLGRELLAVVKLAEAKLSANKAIAGTTQWQSDPTDITPLTTARNAYAEMEATLGEFEAIAPLEWATQYRQSGFPAELAKYRGDLDRAMRSTALGEPASFDTEAFAGLVANGVQFQSAISQSIVERASLEADSARTTTLIRIVVSLVAVLIAAIVALFITRSITRRVKAVSASANQVAAEQLPALVEALRDPRGRAILPEIQRVDAKGNDELAELASAFNSMQDTLVEVAHEQVEVLRRGVSEIFVTMARRNRSLIDRQLSLLDEFEAEVDDPIVLGNYYQLDHLATRMRRNSESLLVLANAEPKRRRAKATEIDDVVRASIGEVEDYRRVDVEHLEPLQVRGTVVADVAHLIAELLDNATAFSPPDSTVRVGGRHTDDMYLLRIVDSGIGIPTDRLRYLNDLLREPPVAGLSVESTLGISVVSMLANKHGIAVRLEAGNPGLSVDIVLPSNLFGPAEQPRSELLEASDPPTTAAASADLLIGAWNEEDSVFLAQSHIDGSIDSPREFDDAQLTPVALGEHDPWLDQAGPTGAVEAPDAQPVAGSDWTTMSLDLSAFQSGRQSAAPATVEHEPTHTTTSDSATTALDDHVQPDLSAPMMSEFPPPPPAALVHGEFDAPLAPPVSAAGPSRGPVAPASARSAPVRYPSAPMQPSLPIRTPGHGSDDVGPLVEVGSPRESIDDTQHSSPTALESALAAFDPDPRRSAGSLPTRTRLDESTIHEELPIATTPSRLDPEALRERLRAFQTEFSSGGVTADPNDSHGDVGGDRR